LIWKDWLIIEVRLWWDRPSATANNEQFQNNLFSIVQSLNPTLPIWVEDESMLIGQVAIPDAFYTTMREMPVYFLFLWRKEQNTLLHLQVLAMIVDAISRITKGLDTIMPNLLRKA
jgi:hypothetical protein